MRASIAIQLAVPITEKRPLGNNWREAIRIRSNLCDSDWERSNLGLIGSCESFNRIHLEGCEGWNKLGGAVKASISILCDSGSINL
ncbi:hypothetical protein E3N88_02484 [Mikania micrantha]|uniref:Uncharacterized protein n=1 Tax=Mikania micrantha TaxID=192012 RepID=A0A5N6Q654_9ASTR|nr:hypothetical protein E3N88_02484 [Mikania micrantha]